MRVVKVPLGKKAYKAIIGLKLSRLGKILRTNFNFDNTCAVVSAPPIFEKYGKQLVDVLTGSGFTVHAILIKDGEKSKNLDSLTTIYDGLSTANMGRNSCLVAFGGGVIGDIAGFAAATYLRGIPVIQVPTTLLAMVDSCLGGKTGIDLPQGKNLIGSFYQPALVFIDTSTLASLGERDISSGLAEIIKYGIMQDIEFFEFVEQNILQIRRFKKDVLDRVIWKSLSMKARVVSQDAEERSGQRMMLNLGHTIGHAIEVATDYQRFRHGEAIALGLVASAVISSHLGYLDQKDVERIKSIIALAELPQRIPADIPKEAILEAVPYDKKIRKGQLIFVLPVEIGKVKITDEVSGDLIGEVIEELTG